MGTLSERINSLPTKDRHLEDWSNTKTAWLAGFDTGLYEAEQLAVEADELMKEMESVLWEYQQGIGDHNRIDHVLANLAEWKERTK